LGLASQAQALLLTPSGATAFTNINSNLNTLAEINTAFGTAYVDLEELYKADVGDPVVESESLAPNYTTVYKNTSDDPSGATITWDGGDFFDCPTCFLIVKDGNNEPAQYLFDLAEWDGKETLVLEDFWPEKGAISHISIWGREDGGGGDDEIPEPGILFLMGAGLMGLGYARRRKQ